MVDAESAGMFNDWIDRPATSSWDDRHSIEATIDDLRSHRVRQYLRTIRSGLLDETDFGVICRKLRVIKRVDDRDLPKNIGLLMFTDDPMIWFLSAKLEVVLFADDGSGDVQEERVFTGSLTDQTDSCMKYLQAISSIRLEKKGDQIRVERWANYPFVALRESLVNAICHRSYRPEILEPTKVYVYPDRIEFISYPGPVPGLDVKHFSPDSRVPPMPVRNRRVGEFLRNLQLAEGRLTGVSKIYRALKENGSPPPKFDFDEYRSYFRTTIYAHLEYNAIISLRDAILLQVLGNHSRANERLQSAWSANPNSALLASELIKQYLQQGKLSRAERVFETFKMTADAVAIANVLDNYHQALVASGETEEARKLIDDVLPKTQD